MKCRECHSSNLRKDGHQNGKQRWECKNCGRIFRSSYQQEGNGEHLTLNRSFLPVPWSLLGKIRGFESPTIWKWHILISGARWWGFKAKSHTQSLLSVPRSLFPFTVRKTNFWSYFAILPVLLYLSIILLGAMGTGIVQRLVVQPNELAREKPSQRLANAFYRELYSWNSLAVSQGYQPSYPSHCSFEVQFPFLEPSSTSKLYL